MKTAEQVYYPSLSLQGIRGLPGVDGTPGLPGNVGEKGMQVSDVCVCVCVSSLSILLASRDPLDCPDQLVSLD